MPTNILMPALSPTMEKGKLAKWLKKEGDTIKSGDVIAEIETDKATMEVEAVDEGTLGKIIVAEGTDDVAVNTPIAVILGEGEDASAIKTAAPSAPQAKAAPQAAPEKARGAAEVRCSSSSGNGECCENRTAKAEWQDFCLALGAAARPGEKARSRHAQGLGSARADRRARHRCAAPGMLPLQLLPLRPSRPWPPCRMNP